MEALASILLAVVGIQQQPLPPEVPPRAITCERQHELSRALRDDTISVRERVEIAVAQLMEEIAEPSAPTSGFQGGVIDSNHRLLRMAIDLINSRSRPGFTAEFELQLELRRGSPEAPHLLAVVVGHGSEQRDLFELLDLWNERFHAMRPGLRLSILRALHYPESPLALGVVRRALLFRTALYRGRGCVRTGDQREELWRCLAWDGLWDVLGPHGARMALSRDPKQTPAVDLAPATAKLGYLARSAWSTSEARRRAIATRIDLTFWDPAAASRELASVELTTDEAAELDWRSRMVGLLRDADSWDARDLTDTLLAQSRDASEARLTWLFEEIARRKSPRFAAFLQARCDLVAFFALRDPEGTESRVERAYDLASAWSGLPIDVHRLESLTKSGLYWTAQPEEDPPFKAGSRPRTSRGSGTSASSSAPGRD